MTDFNKQIDRIRAAGADPRALALVTLDIVLASRPPELERVMEAAAIPHWFDESILTSLLDEDLRPAARQWFEAVIVLPAIERFPARSGYNVHEATRLGLRQRLAQETPERFAELSLRAMATFEGSSAPMRIEQAFHRLAYAPSEGGPALRDLEGDLAAHSEDHLALARTLAEYGKDTTWPPLVRAWALLMQVIVRQHHIPLDEALGYAESSRALFEEAGDAVGDEIASWHLGDLLSLRASEGDSERALSYLERALSIAQRVLDANPRSAGAVRDLSTCLERIGGYYLDRGRHEDAESALEYFTRALQIKERYYEENPDRPRAAGALIYTLIRIGDFHMERRAPRDAAVFFMKAMEIGRRLAAAYPDDEQAARDASVAVARFADDYLSRDTPGDIELALASYNEALAIQERLYEANRDNARAARDVSVSLLRIGDALLRQGHPMDTERALACFERSLEIAEQLYNANPHNAQIAGGVSAILQRLGDIYLRRSDSDAQERALAYFERSLWIAERLHRVNPLNVQTTRNLAIFLEKLGFFYSQRRHDPSRASTFLERAMVLFESLYAANSLSANAGRDLWIAHYSLFALYWGEGMAEQAARHRTACLAVLDALGRERPMDQEMLSVYEALRESEK